MIVAIEEVYLKRLRAIAPTATELGALAEAYLNTIQPGAPEVIAALHDAEVDVHLVSGGLFDAIIPLAFELGTSGTPCPRRPHCSRRERQSG